MKSIFSIMIACVILSAHLMNSEMTKHRVKRKVMFTRSSKYFFRFNGKLVLLNYTSIFQFGYGSLRVNWDLPHDLPRRYQFFKRSIHEEIDNIPNEHVSKIVSCWMERICDFIETFKQINSCGFLCELGNLITRENGIEGNFFKNFYNKCDYYRNICLYT